MEETTDLPWLQEPVRLRLLTGASRYLLDARRERCCECATGTRVISVWVCRKGRAESVSWCGHCFNAICEKADLSEAQRQRFQAIRLALKRGEAPRSWPAARPALEDLERRGLF